MMIDLEEIKKEKKPEDEDANEDDDENFIDKWEQNSFSADKKANVFDELKSAVKDAVGKLKDATEIFSKKKQLRTLDREVGGTESDYDEASKKNDMDKDLWDLKEIGSKAATEEIAFESSQNESFIHDKKTKRGKKRGRRVGAMILNNAPPSASDKKLTFGEKIKQVRTMKQDRGNGGYEQDGNGGGDTGISL